MRFRALRSYLVWAVLLVASGNAFPAAGRPLYSIENPSPASWASFGRSIAFSGQTLLIGADGQRVNDLYSGVVYGLDARNGTATSLLVRPVVQNQGGFGRTIAAVGSQALVGDYRWNAGYAYSQENVGAAYLFDLATGTATRTFANPTNRRHDYFGADVAAFGDDVLVGSLEESGGGGVVYLMDGATGGVIREFRPPDPAKSWQFGWHLASAGRYVVVGCPTYDSQNLTNSGAVFVFDGNTGQLLRTLESPSPQAYQGYGIDVAVANGRMLVANPSVKQAYLYDLASGDMVQSYSDVWGDAGSFGSVVAFAGDKPAIGSTLGPGRLFQADSADLLASLPLPRSWDLPGTYSFGMTLGASTELVVVGNPAGHHNWPSGGWVSDSGIISVYEAPEPVTLLLLGLGALAALRRGKGYLIPRTAIPD